MGDNGRQWETRGNKRRQGQTRRETRGDKTSGRRTHHPTQAHMQGQWETIRKQDVGKADTPSQHRHTCRDNGSQFGNKTSGRRTHHPTQVHTCGETMGENGEQWGTWGAMGGQGRQDLEKAGTPSNTNAYCGETIGDKRRQDLGKADLLLLLLLLLLILKVLIVRAGSARLFFARVLRLLFCAGSAFGCFQIA